MHVKMTRIESGVTVPNSYLCIKGVRGLLWPEE
jgi:hypothetical protein